MVQYYEYGIKIIPYGMKISLCCIIGYLSPAIYKILVEYKSDGFNIEYFYDLYRRWFVDKIYSFITYINKNLKA